MHFKHISWLISKDTEPIKFIRGDLEIISDEVIFRPKVKLSSGKAFRIKKGEVNNILMSRFYYKTDNPENAIANIPGVELKLKISPESKQKQNIIKLLAQGSWIHRFLPKSVKDLHDFPRTKYLNQILRMELGFELSEEEKTFFKSNKEYNITPQKIREFKEILKNNSKISLEMLQSFFNIDKDTFNKIILEWSRHFDFKIDGDYLLTQNSELETFIEELDNEFNDWSNAENLKEKI